MSEKTTAAARQRNFRSEAEKEFGVKPWTILVTDCEKPATVEFFKRRFGHALTVTSRRQLLLKIKAREAKSSPRASDSQQMELI